MEIKTMTPLEAKNLIAQRPTWQRDINATNAQAMRSMLASGSWDARIAPVIVGALPDGRQMIIDGQHRLSAIASHDSPVQVWIERVPLGQESEARQMRFTSAYARPQGIKDRMRSIMGESADSLSSSQREHLISAVRFVVAGFRHHSAKRDPERDREHAAIATACADAWLHLCSVIEESDGDRSLRRTMTARSFGAPWLALHCAQAPYLDEFAVDVAKDSGDRRAPSRLAAEALKMIAYARTQTAQETAAKVLRCYIAYAAGKPLIGKLYATLPEAIPGVGLTAQIVEDFARLGRQEGAAR